MMKTCIRLVLVASSLYIGAYAVGLADAFIPNLSDYPTKSELNSIKAQIPTPAVSLPPSEVPGGSVGSTMTFRRGDAVQPRITRSKTVTLDANGTATFDWTTQGPLTTPVQVVLGPVYAGTGIPKCWVTAASATSASIKCSMETVAIVTVATVNIGSITNTSASGMQVGIVVLPPS